MIREETKEITEIVLKAAKKARRETRDLPDPEPELTRPVNWPITCTVGPGLEGAIACESRIGFVNGTKGALIYRGYDIFDLAAGSTYEEICYLLLHGRLPTMKRLNRFKKTLAAHRATPRTLSLLMNVMRDGTSAMGALRMGTNLMRQEFTNADLDKFRPDIGMEIGTDEDSIGMETHPVGEEHAIYEFMRKEKRGGGRDISSTEVSNMESCYHLIAGVSTLAAAIARIRSGRMPIDPDPELSHASNYLYMLTGKRPTPVQERVMDISLILHADHGINASTFASLVVASTLADMYFSVGSGIAALHGPLHGGANERVVKMLRKIGGPDDVKSWLRKKLKTKQRIMGFGHRVYKAYDPRARILGPLAAYLVKGNKEMRPLIATALELEKQVIARIGKKKGIFPNVDFFSGVVYSCLGIPEDMFTPTFAVSRVAGWTARVIEYLENNRIFRPRAHYVGPLDRQFVTIDKRGRKRK